MPAVYFFLIDVSMNAIQTGATAAACSAIQQVLSDLPVSFLALSNYLNVQDIVHLTCSIESVPVGECFRDPLFSIVLAFTFITLYLMNSS